MRFGGQITQRTLPTISVTGPTSEPDYLNRIIKKETGMTFGVYLKHYRIQNVCHMLTHTQASIKEIMYQCGFQDAKYFFSTFKREMGVTPAQYREINRK